MDHEDITFEEFLAARMREKGLSAKRLSEMTGIAPAHLENLISGHFDVLPSAPYFRGYLIRLGKTLDFDGEAWWKRIQKGTPARRSGPSDALPSNRFMKRDAQKWIWVTGIIVLLVVLYLAFELSRIIGKPVLTVTTPPQTPYITASSTLTLAGVVQGADTLYLSNGGASSSEEIMVSPDGTWQKSVLLQGGPNAFRLTAKKFLGSETTVTEEVIYQAPTEATSTASSSDRSTTAPSSSPATPVF